MKPTLFARVPLVLLIAFLLTLPPLGAARATTNVWRTCDEAGLDAAIAAGGANTLACSYATTIIVSNTKYISVNGTILDGNGFLTVSGGGVRRVFEVPSGVTATFQNMTIRDGHSNNGAGISSLGPLVITNVYFLSNTVTGAGGALVANGGSLKITGSTFCSNAATGANTMGGAIFLPDGTSATITNSTFYNNSAERGGAILTSGKLAPLTVIASTFAGNLTTDAYGGTAMFIGNATATLQNTILSTPGAGGRNCNGSIVDGGNNLQFGGAYQSCGATVATGDPKLASLDYYGGKTPTMALLHGSAAIDKIPVAQCLVTTDQRGYHRPANGGSGLACDVGAFEVQPVFYLPLIRK